MTSVLTTAMCGFFKDLSLPSSHFNLHEFFIRYQFAIYHQAPNNYFGITFLVMQETVLQQTISKRVSNLII